MNRQSFKESEQDYLSKTFIKLTRQLSKYCQLLNTEAALLSAGQAGLNIANSKAIIT